MDKLGQVVDFSTCPLKTEQEYLIVREGYTFFCCITAITKNTVR